MEIVNNYGDEIKLTSEQEACVDYLGDRTLMVKGYAGAGKSVVLQAAAKQFMEKYTRDKNNGVLFLTFNKALCSATKEMLDNNGDKSDYIRISTLDSFLYDVYKHIGAPSFKIINKEKNNKSTSEQQKYTHKYFIERALKEHENQYGHHRFHNVDIDFWKDEFLWMKEMNVTSEDRAYYLSLQRRGRGGKVRMNSADRMVAFQLFTYYEAETKKAGYGDWIDYALYIIRHPEIILDEYKYDFVLIDEAQDLSLAHMMAAVMFVKNRMVVAMDANQRIYSKNWTPKQLGIESTTKKLTKSMRTTIQIDNLAESVRKHNDDTVDEDDRMLRAIPERSGQLPEVAHFASLDEEKKYVISIVKQVLKTSSKCSIGIIACMNKQLKFYGGWMTDAGVHSEIIDGDATFSMRTPGVKICNVYNAKGLEFDVVIIPQFQEGYFPYDRKFDNEEDRLLFITKARNLAYVAMTRAKQVLYITYNGSKGSRFIGEMDKELYKGVGDITWYGGTSGQIKKVTPEKIKPTLPPVIKKPVTSVGDYKNLTDYFHSKGLEVVDKRIHGGALWVAGTKSEIDIYVREVGKLFGAFGNYVDAGKSKALKLKAGWFTKSQK